MVTERRTFRLAEHSSSRTSRGVSTGAYDATVTDIIPFNEFGDLSEPDGELTFNNSSAFDREARVIHAPELDDMHDTDDLVPLRLVVPNEFRPAPGSERRASRAYR